MVFQRNEDLNPEFSSILNLIFKIKTLLLMFERNPIGDLFARTSFKYNVQLTRCFLLQKIMDDLDVDPKDEKVTYSEFRAGMKSHWHLFKPKINKYVLTPGI